MKFPIYLLLLFSRHSHGKPYLNEDLFEGVETNNAFYPFDPCAKCSFDDTEINWKDLNPKHSDLHPIRKNRDVDHSLIEEDLKYGVLSPRHELDDVKTISFPALFTPRFGRKRFAVQPTFEMSDGNFDVMADNTMPRLSISKKAASIALNSRNALKPRSSRFKSYNKKFLSHRNEFSPRIGRSSAQNLVQLSAGSAFTPRLGRSARDKQIRLNAGSVFTPRFGRSENPNQILLSAGSAFTPRLGRSENQNQIHLSAGSAFTPRLGRSENRNQIHLSAGSPFSPRLGRSENPNEIHFNAGSAFTPRFGRSEGINLEQGSEGFLNWNDENVFAPRTSENSNMISWMKDF